MKPKLDTIRKACAPYAEALFKWGGIAVVMGLLCGAVGSVFHISVEKATQWREETGWLIYLLPVAGLLIPLLYKALRVPSHTGTNEIFQTVKHDGDVPLALAPAIFAGTFLTHLFGGSAGREGAALQLGGSMARTAARVLKLDADDTAICVVCGMAALFSALFGTPLTATFFTMEVVHVGTFYYASLLPCVTASLVALGVGKLFGVAPVAFTIANIPALSVVSALQTAGLGVLCALVAIVFCELMHFSHERFAKWLPNEYARIFVGGAAVLALTLLCGTRAYNGAGMGVIESAMRGVARPEAFALKMLFTALTIGSGYRGGEIVPTFFIGATFGCVAGGLLGMDAGFAASVGLVALFCGATNTPVASILLGLELFGAAGLPLYALAAAVSFLLSGYFSLYGSQRIDCSKLTARVMGK